MTILPAELSFFYLRCCRVHKLVPGLRIGRCGLCGERPTEEATEEEYEMQEGL